MAERWGGMQGMQVAAEPLSAPPYATECAMTLDGRGSFAKVLNKGLFGKGSLAKVCKQGDLVQIFF